MSVDPAGTRTSVTLRVPSPLRDRCGGARDIAVTAPDVRAALAEIERIHPNLYQGICDETGQVRRHVNVFVNNTHMRDREGLDTALRPGDVISILPAVSGG
jgi:molybdopterin synthase sulfur carrier subunit